MTATRSAMLDPFGILSPEMTSDPYPIYDRLRREAPVYFCEPWGAWLFTRYDDVLAAFRDPRLSSNRAGLFGGRPDSPTRAHIEPLFRHLRSWALLMDPPSHTRLRALLNKAFTPRLAEWLRPRVEQLVGELLDVAARAPEVDVIAALATPLPVTVIGEMLGVPREDGATLKAWSDTLAAFVGAGRPTAALAQDALRVVTELEQYFRVQIAARRSSPGSDLLSALIASEESGAILGEQELLSTCSMILFGGHETTTHLIGNGLRALLLHPEQKEIFAQSPGLAPSVVDEILRFDGPVQRMGRIAREPLEVRGAKIGRGDRIFLMLGAANRDPDQFPNAGGFDVARDENKHLGLGFGTHYCVGAALGRLEAQVALRALVVGFPQLALLDPTPPRVESQSIRGLRELRVRLT